MVAMSMSCDTVNQKIVAVIPALNEADTIGRVVREVKKCVDLVIVVDDHSGDNTSGIAKEAGALVFTNIKNQGYDKTIDRGFELSADKGATIIITFDADGQHNAEDINKIVGPIVQGEADLVVGRRPQYARIMEYLFAFVAKRKVGIDDPLCGLKAYRVEVYKDVGYFDRISSIGTQLMFKAKNKGYRIIQKDIFLTKRKDTPRFGKSIKANYKIFKAVIKTLVVG